MRLFHSIAAHKDKVWLLSCHDELPLLATASADKTLRLYRLSKNFPHVATLDETHPRLLRCVAFKPQLHSSEPEFVDLPALACCLFDLNISVWGFDVPRELDEMVLDDDTPASSEARKRREREVLVMQREWHPLVVIEGHANEVKAVAWNHSGSLLALCLRDKTVWIWETDTESLEEFECVAVLSDHSQDVKHIAWHPRQNLLASALYDDTLRLYSDANGDWGCVATLNGHTGTVWLLCFEHPNAPTATGKIRLASASDDLSVRVWSSAGEREHLPHSIKEDMPWEAECVLPKVHTHAVYLVAWSPRTGRIASAGADGRVAVYAFGTEWAVEHVAEKAHGVYEVNCVQWAVVDGTEMLLSSGDDGNVNVWAFE